MPITTPANSEISSVLMNPELEQQVGATETASKAAPVDDRYQPFCFSYRFSDAMLMAADVQTVGEYLDAHQGWFTRCAHPIKVNPIGQNGYELTIGKFNSCGYIVEPKIGLELSPPESGVYQIRAVEIPNYTPPGYQVSFNAQMRLLEFVNGQQSGTKIDWDLDLNVYIQFPKFIYKLPIGVIQGTGDKVLKQIVNRVSRQLTHQVQRNFHGNLGLKIPKCSIV